MPTIYAPCTALLGFPTREPPLLTSSQRGTPAPVNPQKLVPRFWGTPAPIHPKPRHPPKRRGFWRLRGRAINDRPYKREGRPLPYGQRIFNSSVIARDSSCSPKRFSSPATLRRPAAVLYHSSLVISLPGTATTLISASGKAFL